MRIKVCGIRRLEDALLASDAGASAIGFIFWPASPRFIDPFRARTVAAALPPFVTRIGVFVNQPPDYVKGVVGLVKLGGVQLHGDEDPALYSKVGVPVIKSVAVDERFRPSSVEDIPNYVTVLLDAQDPVLRGGTGRTIDWSAAADAAGRRRVILSGGLTPSNVRDAVAAVSPYAVDVSSGVESSPGVKDAAKLRAFCAAIAR
ncbi:MAG: phosphoribosylanthranilate isomerase [Acidobacteria bacterium]|nr:phosphoribosylanthranilate isomerase [Acidobacteriota bacterium]MCA1652456.1 phosphoribosylanthranilate isomerase [Acidobacteriota bacterium]